MTISSDARSGPRGAPHGRRGRIAERFAMLAAKRRTALVCYVTAGHPDEARSLALLQGLADAGADVIEVGVPFSDPMADGPVIQASSQIALAGGMTMERTLALVDRAALPIPTVLFSYLNPVLSGGSALLQRLPASGIDGLLITDLPVGADLVTERRVADCGVDFVRLVAPTTPLSRMQEIARHGSGFVYLISRLGVTGARVDLPPDLSATVARLRSATALPICVGFGISTPEQAAAVSRVADGVVVGSALVRAAGESVERALHLVRSLRAALDGV